MFIFHILVYVFFTWCMFNFAKKSEELEPKDNNKLNLYLWLYIGFFTLISAIRWNVGADCLSYIHFFKSGMDSKLGTNESLFHYIVDFIHSNHIHFTIGLGVCAFVQIFFTVKGILPAKYLLPYFAIVLFGNETYVGMMNAVRQMMAAAIFIFAVKFIPSKKPIIYAGLIFIASLIHHSALILLPLYFIPYKWNITNKRTILIGIYIACFIIGMTPNFQDYMESIKNATAFFGYDNHVSDVTEILDNEYIDERRAFGPMQLSYFLSGLIAIWYGAKLHSKYANKIPVFNLWYLFSTAYSCFYFLLCNVSHLILRPILYFQLFQTVILSLLLYDMFNENLENKNSKTLAKIFVLIIWVALCWDIIKNADNSFEFVIYKTSLFK